ncbi:hypothetical protein BH09BAC1_BH09BAC1_24970 [soil metagenome]
MVTYTITVNDPDEIKKLETFVEGLSSASVREKRSTVKGLENIESIAALNRRVQEGRQMIKSGLYLTDNELDKEIQQWLGEKP